MLLLNNITLEGADLAGKTTLMKRLHKETKNKYNIIDRSLMSALVYARLYKRPNISLLEKQLRDDLNNLNNRTIVLMPDLELLGERYNKRGDEIQNWHGIIKIREAYEEVLNIYESFSTVHVARNSSELPWEPHDEVLKYLANSETSDIPYQVRQNAIASDNEAFPVTFEVNLGASFMTSHADALEHQSEKAYYTKILSKMLTTITKENIGDNPYGKPQDPKATRRYIYADDSCIALFHMMYRKDRLNFYATLRSSDVVNIFEHDYKFLLYLCGQCAKAVGIKDYEIPKENTLTITLHSAHIT